MSEKKTVSDANKLEELMNSLLRYKEKINDVNTQITNAIMQVSENWKDFQFDEFKEAYKTFQTDISKFEGDLENTAKVVLPPMIKELRGIENHK